MVTYENECVDCAVPGYPCKGDMCPLRHTKHLYCDKCGDECDYLYELDGYELCKHCVLSTLNKIE